MLERQVGVGERLRLHALRGVHDQHGALARGERAADLVVEVHVARGVDEVERVGLAAAVIRQADGCWRPPSRASRGAVPAVSALADFRTAVQNAKGAKILFYEGGGAPLSVCLPAGEREVSVFIGPEGRL